MSEFIENPFGELWSSFDINDFKKRICDLIDKMNTTTDSNEIAGMLGELDDMIMSYVIVLKLKDVEAIEVIKVTDLPKELIEELGFDEVDMIDGYVPKSLIPEEFHGMLEKPKKKKNNWLIDK